MIRLFGYDDASGRNWINLEFVARARYDKARHTVECVLANGGDKSGERITLQGDAAAAFAKALALIEKDERKA